MPGGEGSPAATDRINSDNENFGTNECAVSDNDKASMTVTGDGLRRRKVIHAAKETLDKGESIFGWGKCGVTFFFLPGVKYSKTPEEKRDREKKKEIRKKKK